MNIKTGLAVVAFAAGSWMLHTSLIAPQGASPEKVVKSFLTALQKADFEKAKKYGDENTGKLMDLMKMMAEQMPKGTEQKHGKVTNVDCEIDGDKGVCKACCNADGEALQDVPVQKIDGKWLVVMNKEDMNKELPSDAPPVEEVPED